MKVTSVAALVLATLTLASPVARPEAEALVLSERAPEAAPVHLDERKIRKPKSTTNHSSAATLTITPSRALQLGAIGIGAVEMVRLWAY